MQTSNPPNMKAAVQELYRRGVSPANLRQVMKEEGYPVTDENYMEVKLVVKHGHGDHEKTLRLPLPMRLPITREGKSSTILVDLHTDVDADDIIKAALGVHVQKEAINLHTNALRLSCMICSAPDPGNFNAEIEMSSHEWLPGICARVLLTLYLRCSEPACYVATTMIRKRKLAGTSILRKCYNPSCDKVNVELKACSGCGMIKVCSVACQRAVWDMHKPDCKRMRAAKDEQKKRKAKIAS